MVWATVVLFLFVSILVVLYFLPYKTLKGKIFKKLYHDTLSINRVVYKGNDFAVEIIRKGDHWKMVSPVLWQADTAKMRHLMVKISELEVTERLRGKNPADKIYNIGKNGILELYNDTQTTVFEFGTTSEDGESLYLTKDSDSDILTVHISLLACLPKSVDDFRRTLLFETAISDIWFAEIVTENKSSLMTRTDTSWILNGKNTFEDTIIPILENITQIQGESFAPQDIQLPAKYDCLITIKGKRKKAVTRLFFKFENNDDKYLVPMKGEVLVVKKESVNDIF